MVATHLDCVGQEKNQTTGVQTNQDTPLANEHVPEGQARAKQTNSQKKILDL